MLLFDLVCAGLLAAESCPVVADFSGLELGSLLVPRFGVPPELLPLARPRLNLFKGLLSGKKSYQLKQYYLVSIRR